MKVLNGSDSKIQREEHADVIMHLLDGKVLFAFALWGAAVFVFVKENDNMYRLKISVTAMFH